MQDDTTGSDGQEVCTRLGFPDVNLHFWVAFYSALHKLGKATARSGFVCENRFDIFWLLVPFQLLLQNPLS